MKTRFEIGPNLNLTTLRRTLTIKCLAVLGAIALLLTINCLVFLLYFKKMVQDGYLIDLSGHQRMLSQRILLLAFAESKATPGSKPGNRESQNDLTRAITMIERSHHELTQSKLLSPFLRKIYFEPQYSLDQKMRDFIAVSKAGEQELVKFSLRDLNLLLNGLEQAVEGFKLENSLHNRRVLQLQILLLALDVLVLILSGLFVFKPMVDDVVRSTESVLSEQKYTKFLLEATSLVNEAKTVVGALETLIQCICSYTGWPVGHAYVVSKDDDQVLVSAKIWNQNNHRFFSNFQEATEKTPLKIGIGLPGRVLESGEPLWINDVSLDSNFPRNKVAVNLGVHAGFAFPVLFRGKTMAVLEFFSDKIIEKNPSLLKTISHVGRQLGLLYERENYVDEIRLMNEFLEKRIEERTQELEQKNTELALKQQALVMISKMSALGEMAGGVAHEINNPLSSIKNLLSQLQEVVDEEPLDRNLLKEMAQTAEDTTDRIAKIILGLRSFSREGGKDPLHSVNVPKLIEETLSFCNERFRSRGIKLDILPMAKDLSFEGISTQISQVLLNLINNAHDAVLHLNQKWVNISASDEGSLIEFRITDCGNGIPKDIQQKIFQPFFTTKEIGKGTGIGLSISTGIIQRHHGELVVDPVCPNTCFVIRLPKKQPVGEVIVSSKGEPS